MNIASIGVAGTLETNTWTPDNKISLNLSCDKAPLVVETDPKPDDLVQQGFALAVAGNCGTQVSCGWLALRIAPNDDGTEVVDIATATTPIVVRGVNQPGSYTVSLELHDAFDNILHTSDGKVLGQEAPVELLLPASCPAVSNGDAG